MVPALRPVLPRHGPWQANDHPEHRRQGIGGRLKSSAGGRCRDAAGWTWGHGRPGARWSVHPDNPPSSMSSGTSSRRDELQTADQHEGQRRLLARRNRCHQRRPRRPSQPRRRGCWRSCGDERGPARHSHPAAAAASRSEGGSGGSSGRCPRSSDRNRRNTSRSEVIDAKAASPMVATVRGGRSERRSRAATCWPLVLFLQSWGC